MIFTWLLAALLLTTVTGHPALRRQECPSFDNGTIVIDSYQLYPENADFNLNNCLIYFGAVYNASVVVYDPYKAETVSTLEFPNITRTVPFHIGGVVWDPYTNLISILVDAAPAHETAGQDISGDNYIMRYDPATMEIVWFLNITEVSQGVYGGQQDVEHDSRGHVYVLGTYPGTILRVEPDGSALDEWYVPAEIDHTVSGYSGLAATGDILLVSDTKNNSESGEIYRFDMTAEKGTPVLVPRTPSTALQARDAIYLPPKYGGTVLLVTEHDRGVSVLRSEDGKWEAAEYLGLVPNDPDLDEGALVVAAVEVAGSLYMVEEWFTDPLVPGTSAGNRTEFPLVDITKEVEGLLAA